MGGCIMNDKKLFVCVRKDSSFLMLWSALC